MNKIEFDDCHTCLDLDISNTKKFIPSFKYAESDFIINLTYPPTTMIQKWGQKDCAVGNSLQSKYHSDDTAGSPEPMREEDAHHVNVKL